ncbi:MAG: hypothetical protein RDV48_29375 [Candidatus Eremiobacteraeota bacterium]|nr:hypothetical protein [Candidatus Eremiobacteraeota bacterium]
MASHGLEILRQLLLAAGRNAPGVLLRLAGFTALGLALGIAVFLLWYRLVARKRWLEVHPGADPLIRFIVLLVWVFTIPFLSGAAGLVMGTTSACIYVVTHEHLGVKAGELAFQAIAVAVVMQEKSAQGMGSSEQLLYARGLMEGEKTVPISYIKTIVPRHIAEVSVEKIQGYIPSVENGFLRVTAVVVMERSISWMVYAAASDSGDIIYRLCEELAKTDNSTDSDGTVTVKEIASAVSRVYFEREATKWIFWAGAIKSLFLLATLAAILVAPPLLAGITRYFLKRRSQGKSPVLPAAPPADSETPERPLS